MNDDADTVTPLDGDGSNVTGLDAQFDTLVNPDPEPEDHSTEGRVTVATRRGYRFDTGVTDAEGEKVYVTSEGLEVPSVEVADALIEASDGLVFEVVYEDEEEGE